MSALISPKDTFYVAGHSGMAGSAICRALKRKGYNQLLTTTRDQLDLRDALQVDRWFYLNKPNVVAIAAAKVGGILANNSYPADFLLDNLKIQTNLIEAAWRYGIKRLLFLGSSCIYPKIAQQPLREEELLSGYLESTNQWYAIAKISGLKLCEALRKQHNFDAICLMPTNLYGPGDNYHPKDSHVLPGLIRRFCEATQQGLPSVTCWGSGSPLREFLHADDLGDACVFALENWSPSLPNAPVDRYSTPLNHLNVGTGSDISIKHLAQLVASATGYTGEITWDKSKPDGTHRKLLDTSRLLELGWKSSISLNDGIIMTVDEFRSNLRTQTARL